MAAGSATAAWIAAGAGAAQAVTGISQTNEAKQQIEDFELDQAYNPYEAMIISTEQEQLMMEQANKNLATAAETTAQSGSRAAGNINEATAQANQIAQQAGASISQKEADKQNKIAGGSMGVQSANMQQQMAELSGYAQLYNYGQSMINNGISTGVGGTVLALTAPGGAKPATVKDPNPLADTPVVSSSTVTNPYSTKITPAVDPATKLALGKGPISDTAYNQQMYINQMFKPQ